MDKGHVGPDEGGPDVLIILAVLLTLAFGVLWYFYPAYGSGVLSSPNSTSQALRFSDVSSHSRSGPTRAVSPR